MMRWFLTGKYLFTTNKNEVGRLVQTSGWQYEGIAFFGRK